MPGIRYSRIGRFCEVCDVEAHGRRVLFAIIHENLTFFNRRKPTTTIMMFSVSAKKALAASRVSLQRNSAGATRGFAKQIKFGVEGRAAMLKGVNTLADAVQVCF